MTIAIDPRDKLVKPSDLAAAQAAALALVAARDAISSYYNDRLESRVHAARSP